MSDYIPRLFSALSRLFTFTSRQEQPQKHKKEPPSSYSTACQKFSPNRKNSSMNLDLNKETKFNKNPECGEMMKLLPRASSESTLTRCGVGKLTRPGTPLENSRKLTFQRNENSNDDEMDKDTDFVLCQETFDTNSANETSMENCNTNLRKSASDINIRCSRIKNKLFSDARKVSSDSGYCKTCDRPLPVKKNLERDKRKITPQGPRVKYMSASSKIPVRSCERNNYRLNQELYLPQRHRGIHTLTRPLQRNESPNSLEEEELIGECAINFKPSDIGNWNEYRNDTSIRFERMFKLISKKKHNIGNVIDSSLHTKWMKLAGIPVNKNSLMFKQFAGGKVVLTFGEYKYFLDKLCTACDMDYWDVLRKMVTFLDNDDRNHESKGELRIIAPYTMTQSV